MSQRLADRDVRGPTGFYRPAYEAIACLAWLVGGLFYVAIARTFNEGISVIGYAALPMFLLSGVRGYQAIQNWSFKTRLTTPLPPWMSVSRLIQKQTSSGETFIGRGFDWEPYHARLMKEISTITLKECLDPPRLFRRIMVWLGLAASNLKLEGRHYIHGVGRQETDLLVSKASRRSHTLVLGTNGAGKTRMLETLVVQAISRGHLTQSQLEKRRFFSDLVSEESKKHSRKYRYLKRLLDSSSPGDKAARLRLIDAINVCAQRGTLKSRVLRWYLNRLPDLSYGPVFILDPKGDVDLRDRAYATAKRLGRANDFFYFSPTDADFSFRINPLANFTRRTELANRIAALLPSGGDSDAFRQFAWRAINVVVEGLEYVRVPIQILTLRDYIEGGIESLLVACLEKHLSSLEHYYPRWSVEVTGAINRTKSAGSLDEEVSRRAAGLAAYYTTHVKSSSKACAQAHPNTTIDGLIDVMMHDTAHYNKLISNLIPILQQLTSSPMDILLSRSQDFSDPRPPTSFQELINQRRIVYINFESLADSVVGSALGSLFIADLTACAAERHHKGITEPPVAIFVDEAAEMMNDPFIQALNKGRAAGFELTLASQTIADFVARMGNQAKALQVLGNVNTTIAMRLQDNDSIAMVVDKFADTSYENKTSSKTSTTIAAMAQRGRDFSGSVMKGSQSTDLQMVTADLLSSLPPGHFFGHLPGGRKVKGRVMLLPLKDSDRFRPSEHGTRCSRFLYGEDTRLLPAGLADPLHLEECYLDNDYSRAGKHDISLVPLPSSA